MGFSWTATSRPLVTLLKQPGTLCSPPPLLRLFTQASADTTGFPASHFWNFRAALTCVGAGAACAYLEHCRHSSRVGCESYAKVTLSSKGLQECGAGILVYVLDCSSSRRQNHGAAKAVLKEFDVKQDFYELRSRTEINSKFPHRPGAIETMLVSNDHVLLVGLCSTAFGGLPEECGDDSGKIKFTSRHPELPGWVPLVRDSSADRKQRFAECLTQLANRLDALHADISGPNNEIAFHYNMGCANAGGKWKEYEAMIQEFADAVARKHGKKYTVAIYGCPIDES